jgi:hypothetical protein
VPAKVPLFADQLKTRLLIAVSASVTATATLIVSPRSAKFAGTPARVLCTVNAPMVGGVFCTAGPGSGGGGLLGGVGVVGALQALPRTMMTPSKSRAMVT